MRYRRDTVLQLGYSDQAGGDLIYPDRDIAVLEAKDKTPSQVKAIADGAPAPIMVNNVIALLGYDKWLSLKTCFAKLVKKSQHFLSPRFHQQIVSVEGGQDKTSAPSRACVEGII